MTSERDVLVKASPLRAVRAFLDEKLTPEARERVLRKTRAEFPAEESYLGAQTPLVSQRVPVIFVNRLIELLADELHEPAPVVAHRIGRRAAEDASHSVLRLVMILISIPSMLKKVGPVWTQMNSHGVMSSRVDGRTAVIELHDYPVRSAIGCARATGMFEWFAEKAERAATVRHGLCRAKDGGEVCRWNIGW